MHFLKGMILSTISKMQGTELTETQEQSTEIRSASPSL